MLDEAGQPRAARTRTRTRSSTQFREFIDQVNPEDFAVLSRPSDGLVGAVDAAVVPRRAASHRCELHRA